MTRHAVISGAALGVQDDGTHVCGLGGVRPVGVAAHKEGGWWDAMMDPNVAKKFRVELEKLRATATKLQQEVDSLRGSADGMAASPNFGDSNIVGVGRLGPKHQSIIGPTQQLISDIQGGIAAGEEALRIVASRYETVDTSNAEEIDKSTTDELDQKGFEEEDAVLGGQARPE